MCEKCRKAAAAKKAKKAQRKAELRRRVEKAAGVAHGKHATPSMADPSKRISSVKPDAVIAIGGQDSASTSRGLQQAADQLAASAESRANAAAAEPTGLRDRAGAALTDWVSGGDPGIVERRELHK